MSCYVSNYPKLSCTVFEELELDQVYSENPPDLKQAAKIGHLHEC